MDTKYFYSFLLVLITFISCKKEKVDVFYTIQGEAQGSTYSIKYIANEELVTKNQIDSLLLAFDLSLSTYRNDSKISKINAGDSTVIVDDLFIETYKASYQIYKETNGLFDPTIGVLVNAYGFGPDHKRKPITEKQVDSLLQFVGFNKVKLNENNTVSKQYVATYFDFNAIAQGYSVDVVTNFLKSKGVQHGIVEIGGELFAFGKNTINKKDWIVGIDDPLQTPDERKLMATIKLGNLGMATSGNYRKVTIDSETGEKFVHTINPITGMPQRSNVLSATVLAPSCKMADGYATAFMVMSLEESKLFIESRPELYVMIVYVDGTTATQQFITSNFESITL